MVEKKPVNVKWQMVFSVIPILDLYASHRIQKFRLWFLIFWIAGTIVGLGYDYAIFGEDFFDVEKDMFSEPLFIPSYILFVIIFALVQLIVMRKWSKEWNENLAAKNFQD